MKELNEEDWANEIICIKASLGHMRAISINLGPVNMEYSTLEGNAQGHNNDQNEDEHEYEED